MKRKRFSVEQVVAGIPFTDGIEETTTDLVAA